MEIRRERPADRTAVAALHNAAFARPAAPGPGPSGAGPGSPVVEAVLIDELRAGPWWIPQLSIVAESGGVVVGHVVATRAVLLPGDPHGSGAVPVLGLGPLGVAPDRQRRGVGSALMHAVLGAAQARDESLVGLLGDPAYYRRFGFVAGTDVGVAAPDPSWGGYFQVRALVEAPPTGAFRYAEPFDRVS